MYIYIKRFQLTPDYTVIKGNGTEAISREVNESSHSPKYPWNR